MSPMMFSRIILNRLSSKTKKCPLTSRYFSEAGFVGTKFDITARRGSDYYYFTPQAYSETVKPAPVDKSRRGGSGKKVSVIGVGQVGLAIAYGLVNQQIASTIALVDMNKTKLEGEADDMIQGSAFHARERIIASTDYSIIENSDLVIVTAGAAQNIGESRLSLVGRNVDIMKQIVPKIIQNAPDANICIASNPCDIMTAVASKIAGPDFPPGKIFGSGTNLDSSRLRTIVANSLEIDTKDVNGYIIGEHGDSSVAAWSTVNVGGVPLLEPGELPNENHEKIHRAVVESAGDVIRKKGYTNWAIGLSCVDIANSVLNNHCRVIPVSTCVRGYLGVKEDVYVSLPCVVGAEGVTKVAKLRLTDHETSLFLKSVEEVWKVQSGIWDDL